MLFFAWRSRIDGALLHALSRVVATLDDLMDLTSYDVIALTPKIVKDGTPDQRAFLRRIYGRGGRKFEIRNPKSAIFEVSLLGFNLRQQVAGDLGVGRWHQKADDTGLRIEAKRRQTAAERVEGLSADKDVRDPVRVEE